METRLLFEIFLSTCSQGVRIDGNEIPLMHTKDDLGLFSKNIYGHPDAERAGGILGFSQQHLLMQGKTKDLFREATR